MTDVLALIHKLQSTDPKKDEFPARFAVLRESVEQPIKEEEAHVHAIARATLVPAELEDLGTRFRESKKHMRRPSRRPREGGIPLDLVS